MTSKAPDSPPPSWSTDPAPIGQERSADGVLRAAANLATVVIPGDVGEEVRGLLWSHYNTPDWQRVYPLARAILEAAHTRRSS